MKNKIKRIEAIATEAIKEGNHDLAIVLHVYLGAEYAGMTSDFARHCQAFAKEGKDAINILENRSNN